jgi:3-hydroxyisobutyrate dehydrogenase-like beta-hydroxyacid dehydrogenase
MICGCEQAKGLESQGALFKRSPREVAEAAEIVVSMLPYNERCVRFGLGRRRLT